VFAESRECFGEIVEWAASEEAAAGLQHADLEKELSGRGRELLRQLLVHDQRLVWTGR
jgi:hypothetical protein